MTYVALYKCPCCPWTFESPGGDDKGRSLKEHRKTCKPIITIRDLHVQDCRVPFYTYVLERAKPYMV